MKRSRMASTLGAVIFSAFLGILMTQASTTIHESIHFFVTKALGGNASLVSANLYTGATKYEYEGSKFGRILIICSPPIAIFFLAWYLWHAFGENSIIRVVSIIMWLYSVLPSSFPLLPGSDFNRAIAAGANPIFIWAIWLLMNGIAYYEIIGEVMERYLGG